MSAVLAPTSRADFIGGTDAAAIVGVSPWLTNVELWQLKTGRRVDEPDRERQRMFERGKKLEPFIRDMVIEKLRDEGHVVELVNSNRRYFHQDYPFMSSEVDFDLMLDGEHINADAKSVGSFARRHWGEVGTDQMPPQYEAQMQHGLMVTGRRLCVVGALRSFDDVDLYWVRRDDELIDGLRACECDFWTEHVLKDVPPEPVNQADVQRLFPKDNGMAVEATAQVREWVISLASVKARIKELEIDEDTLSFKISNHIRPYTELVFAGESIATYKAQTARRIDIDTFRRERPELVEAYTRETTTRVLRLRKNGALA